MSIAIASIIVHLLYKMINLIYAIYNTVKHEENGRHVADICKYILHETFCILTKLLLQVYSQWSNLHKVVTGLAVSMARNRQQAITWTNDDQIICMALSQELIAYWTDYLMINHLCHVS